MEKFPIFKKRKWRCSDDDNDACLAGAVEAGLGDSNTAIYEQHLWVGDWFCYFQFSPLTDRRSSPYSMESLGLESAPPRLGLGAEHGGGTLLPWLSAPTKMSVITWPVYWSLIGWKADHVTRLLGPHKNVAIHREQQTGKMLSEFHSEGLQYSIFRAFHSTKASVEEDL